MRFLSLSFVLLPILEMVVLIKVGGLIGALNTVALVILGGVLGLSIIRRQGFRTMLNARAQMAHGELPALEMLEGFLIAIGGVLMILPGFITDSLGIALLVPPVRKAILRKMLNSGRWQVQQTDVFEGEFYRETHTNNGTTTLHHTIKGDYVRDASQDRTPKK